MEQYEPVYAFGGGEGQGENRKAMSLVRAFRIKVEEEVEKAGGDGSRLTAEALKNAVLSAKLDLSVGQVRGKVHFSSASCSALTQYQAYTLGLFLLPLTMPFASMTSCTIALYPKKNHTRNHQSSVLKTSMNAPCQIDRISQQLSQQGLIDLSRLAMRGERVIAASAYQADMRQSLVQLCVTLLGTMVPKYGSSVSRLAGV